MNALVPINDAADLETIQRTARLLAVSSYFEAKGDTPVAIAQLATKILAGRELGFGPFAAVNGIHIINGKPAVGANLMASAVKASGRYDYRVRKMADDEVVIEFFAVSGGKRESLGESAFSIKDAQAAGVLSNPTWKKFPRNMLFARAMSNGVRWYCPDVFSGNAVYVPEELGAVVDGEGNVIEVQGRVVVQATGEIVTNDHHADVDMGMGAAPADDNDNPFDDAQPEPQGADFTDVDADLDRLFDDDEAAMPEAAVDYAALAEQLTGNGRTLAKWARGIHLNSEGPASEKQYKFLAGTLDALTGAAGSHNRILGVLVGRDVDKGNPPGARLAKLLLDYLLKERKAEDGGKEPNPNYRQDVADSIVAIWNTVA